MVDLSNTIIAKSNQLNADDLTAHPKTITITAVSAGSKEQPIAINYEGDDGKPYMPSKGMRRVMVCAWSEKGEAFVGKSMTLFRNPKVLFGGIEVGGIQISHMSDIKETLVTSLTVNKKSRIAYKVEVLTQTAKTPQQQTTSTSRPSRPAAAPNLEKLTAMAQEMVAFLDGATNYAALKQITDDPKFTKERALLEPHKELADQVSVAEKAALDYFKQGTDVPPDDEELPT